MNIKHVASETAVYLQEIKSLRQQLEDMVNEIEEKREIVIDVLIAKESMEQLGIQHDTFPNMFKKLLEHVYATKDGMGVGSNA